MKYKETDYCKACGDTKNLHKVIDLGIIPLAGYFPKHEELYVDKNFDCFLFVCDTCGMLQTNITIDSDELFGDYRYASSVGLSNHFSDVASYLNDRFRLTDGRTVLEIGSNDGVLLKPLNNLGINAVGIDPSINISKIAKDKGCSVTVDYFSKESSKRHFCKDSFDLVVANNVFAHIDDLGSVIEGIKHCLKSGGVFVAEVHYLLELVKKCQYDFIYHEHIFYHSLYSLNNLFAKHDMTLYDFDLIDVHSGSIRIFVKKGPDQIRNEKIVEQINLEHNAGITSSIGLAAFQQRIKEHLDDCTEYVHYLADCGRDIVGFGASGRSNVFFNMMDLNTGVVKFVFDESDERSNRFIPNCNIPIVKFNTKASELEYDIVLVSAWNYFDQIKKKIKAKNYLVLFPEPKMY